MDCLALETQKEKQIKSEAPVGQGEPGLFSLRGSDLCVKHLVGRSNHESQSPCAAQRQGGRQQAQPETWEIAFTHKKKLFTVRVAQTLKEVAQRGYGDSISGHIQNSERTQPGQPALQVTLLWAGAWAGPSPETPSTHNSSVILREGLKLQLWMLVIRP